MRRARSTQTFAAAFVLAALAALAAVAGRASATPPVPSVFAPIEFLIGDWTGAGTSDAGAGTGGDSFALALDGRVVVRHAHSEYPGANGAASSRYEGMMVVYPDATAAGEFRADSYDNGGHVIHYALVPGTPPNVAQFLSEGTTSRPSFRLTYTLHEADLDVLFELAPPGTASFTTVARGIERRKT